MKNTRKALAALAFAIMALLGAGPANANDFAFYGEDGDENAAALSAEMRWVGWNITPAGARWVAQQVCTMKSNGYADQQLWHWWNFMEPESSSTVTIAMVNGGQRHFCPWLED
jgi:hypothetical protein